MTEKQQQLTFDKGITNVPSDAICSDNTLSESIGMVYDNGEHRVIQKPVEHITSAVDIGDAPIDIFLQYVHKYNDLERYIVATKTSPSPGVEYYILVWGEKDGTTFKQKGTLAMGRVQLTFDNTTKITSIGKTLIVSDDNGIHYYLWDVDNNSYKPLDSIPTPDVELYLTVPKSRNGGTRTESTSAPKKTISSNSYDGILTASSGTLDDWRIADGSTQSDYNNLVVGLYEKNKRTIKQSKCFCEPFFARTAVELYDGSYTHISQPILLFPSIFTNSYGMLDTTRNTLSIETYACELHYVNKSHFEDWSDIVKDVVIFISDGISIYDTSVDQNMPEVLTTNHVIYNGIYRNADSSLSKYHEDEIGASQVVTVKNCIILNPRGTRTQGSLTINRDELINEIEAQSVYYKLCAIGRSYEGTDQNVSTKIGIHTLENITTQEQLEYDDYFSRSTLLPSYMYSYNSRLNLANVRRSMFEGYGYFMPYDNDTYATYTFYVSIKTDNGTKLVRHIEEETYQKQGIWFFYPDSRASHVMIFKGQDCILDENLTEHPSLNGAYYLKGLPSSSEPETPINAVAPNYTTPTPEYLPNYILTSEADNPFVFKAQGYYKVGTGQIKGMSSITQALSEGQFGQYPLLVFSESGIWALSVASTGYYSSIHPMSREVCNNVKSITQTDGAVFFTSEKGLMVVVGNQVKCVSEQLLGREDPFAASKYPTKRLGSTNAFFRNCHIAYDYRDSLLWLFSNSAAANCCYVYSIKSGTFGKVEMATPLMAVNNYPDYLIQVPSEGNKVYSLLNRPSIDSDTGTYNATMLSRPMKLENALALKSIMQVKHIRDFKPYTVTNNGTSATTSGATEFYIYASNNLNDWVQLTSLRGVPWKYYRFGYKFTGLKAVDRFAGTIVITQERRTDKLR